MQSKIGFLLLGLFTLNFFQVNGQDSLTESNPCGIGMHQEQTTEGQIICVDDVEIDSKKTDENPFLWIVVGIVPLIILAAYIKKRSKTDNN